MIKIYPEHADYPNLKIRSVKGGFGWQEFEDPSTNTISNILDRLDDRVKALEDMIKIKDEFLVCYRVGKRPSEALFKRLEKTKKILGIS